MVPFRSVKVTCVDLFSLIFSWTPLHGTNVTTPTRTAVTEHRYCCMILYFKSRIATAKAAFNKKKTLFASTLDLNLRKKLVKCYIWSMALYGVETWTLRAADQKHPESFEMWCWRRMEKISWTDHVRNEEVLLKSQ